MYGTLLIGGRSTSTVKTIVPLDLTYTEPIDFVPAGLSRCLCQAMFGVLLPMPNGFQTVPVRDSNSYSISIANTFHAEEAILLCGQFDHSLGYLRVALVILLGTDRGKDHRIVWWRGCF